MIRLSRKPECFISCASSHGWGQSPNGSQHLCNSVHLDPVFLPVLPFPTGNSFHFKDTFMRALSLSALALAITLSAVAQPPAPRAARQPRAPRANTAAAPAPIVATVVPPALAGPVTYTCGTAKKGVTSLTAATQFTPSNSGWDLNSTPAIAGGICSTTGTDKPFYFSIPVPPGNYRVTLALGGKQASVITVRAEARRLMLQKIPIAANKTETKSIDVNIRIPEFTKPDGTPGRVRLKQREIGNLDWDPKLTLEFNGVNPAFHSLTIQPDHRARHLPRRRLHHGRSGRRTLGLLGPAASPLLPPRRRRRQPRRIRRRLQLLRRRAALRRDHVPHQARRLLLRPVRPQRPEEGSRLPRKISRHHDRLRHPGPRQGSNTRHRHRHEPRQLRRRRPHQGHTRRLPAGLARSRRRHQHRPHRPQRHVQDHVRGDGRRRRRTTPS